LEIAKKDLYRITPVHWAFFSSNQFMLKLAGLIHPSNLRDAFASPLVVNHSGGRIGRS